MRDGGGLGLVDRDGLALLMPTAELELAHRPSSRPSCATSAPPTSTPACSRPCRASSLAYRNDAQTVAAAVAKGNADAAVLLRPVSVETIRAAAAADLRMPEKTTFFAPKPRTGMVFRSLD